MDEMRRSGGVEQIGGEAYKDGGRGEEAEVQDVEE